MDGTAKKPGTPPARKDASAREAFNRDAARRIAANAVTPDDQPCPFDDVPGPNDLYTSFAMEGRLQSLDACGDLDAEFACIVRGW